MKTICEQLGIEVELGKPFIIRDENGDEIYFEGSDGHWSKRQYDKNGNKTYFEDSYGYWCKRQYDENDNIIYFEDSDGYIENNKPKTLTMDEIANKFNIPVEQLKIEKD